MKIIFVGKAGSGKTLTSLIQCPKPALLVDFDDKIDPLECRRYGVYIKHIDDYDAFDRGDTKNVQVIRIPANDYDKLHSVMASFLRDPFEKGIIILDSLSSIADDTINYSMRLRGVGKGKMVGIIDIPDMTEWLAESMFLSSLFIDLKSVPCHVVLLAHMTVVYRENIMKPNEEVKPDKQLLTGGTKIAAKIPTYFNEIWNFQQVPSPFHGEKPTHKVFTKATQECDLARTKSILPYMLDVTYPEYNLWDQVREAKQLEKEQALLLPDVETEELAEF
jgi:hypothetical protein